MSYDLNFYPLNSNPAGYLLSVLGTPNRIDSSGGLNPVIDISASYVGQNSITTLGIIGVGTWRSTIVEGQYGGTGVANTGRLITFAGNLTTLGAFASTFTMTAPTSVTFPTSGTLLTTTGSGASLTGIPLSVSNSDGSLIISPTTGPVVASLNLGHANTWTGVQSFNPGTLVALANTALLPAITFTLPGSVLLTSPIAGSMEIDSIGRLYYTNFSSSRAKVLVEHFVILNTPYTLTSQTAPQKLFNATPNGALTLNSSTTYFFECVFNLSNLSASSGSYGFAFGGTATFTSQAWKATATKVTTLSTPPNSDQATYNITANTVLTTANTSVSGQCEVRGVIRINAGGTLIPQISLTVANAAIVGTNSYFRIWPLGSDTITNLGAWT